MAKRRRIIVVSELFYPDESSTAHILTKIAGGLEGEFDLVVLTGPDSYEGRPQSKSKPPVDRERVFRTWSPKLNKNRLPDRIVRFLVLTVGLGWKTLIKSRRSDIVFAVSNPAPLLVALAIVRKLRRFQLVFLIHDVFPENAAAAGIIHRGSLFYGLIKYVFNWSYGSADTVISIGRDMSEVLADKIPTGARNISLIENWADHPLVERIPRELSMIPSMGLSNKIVIQYAGNIGRAQGLVEFVRIVSTANNDAIRYVFRGSGALSPALQEATEGRQCFILEGAFARADQSQVLGSCDIALVILKPDMYGLGVPSKAYNSLAAGKPVLFLGPKNSEIYRIVETHKVGWAFDWNETDKLIELINSWSIYDLKAIESIGDDARELVETAYTESVQLGKFKDLFRRL